MNPTPKSSLGLPTDELAWVAVDTETSGLHPDDGARVACISLTWPDPERWEGSADPDAEHEVPLITAAFPFDQGERDKLPTTQLDLWTHNQPDPNLGVYEWAELMGWLAEQNLVFHNAKFDLTMIKAGTRHWEGMDLSGSLVWDTMLAQRIIYPTEPMGLDASAKRLGLTGKQGLTELKKWLESRGHKPYRYDLAPWDLVEEYVSADTELTAKLYLHQLSLIEQGEVDSALIDRRMDTELRLLVALYNIEQRGVKYDADRSAEIGRGLSERADQIAKTLPFPATPAGASKYFYGELGLKPDRVSEKTGRPTLDEEQVRKWRKQGVQWADEYAELNKLRRAVSMWYQGYAEKIGVDGRLRTTFRQGHVKSGRMSVERVQLQAMPKKDKNLEGVPGVRELLQCEPGMGLWNLDLSQAELRVASRIANCTNMLEMLARGVDLHGETNKQVLRAKEEDPDWKETRDIAKRLTFGGIFQIGPKTFRTTLAKLADIEISTQKAYELIMGWRNMYPEFTWAYQKAENTAKRQGFVRLLRGTEFETRSHFGTYDYHHTAWSRIVQGSLAEAFKHLLIGVDEKWPGALVLTVHDSLVLELPLDEGDQVAGEIVKWGGELMSNLFDIEMRLDQERYL